MKTRNLILAICGVLVLVGLGALLHVLTDPDPLKEELAASPGVAEAPGAEPGSLDDFDGTTGTGARTDRTPRDIREASAVTAGQRESDPAATGFAAEVVVRYSGDGAPAAGVTFYLFNADLYRLLETDEQGRCVSDPIFQPGATEFRHRVAAEPGPNRRKLRFLPETVTLAGAVGETVPVELTLLRAEAAVDVLVVHRDDLPAVGASVELQYRTELREGEPGLEIAQATTLADGSAGFALYDLEQIVAAGLIASLEAVGTDGRKRALVSAQHDLELPIRPQLLAEPVRLVLDEGGRLLIRVKDTEGSPVTGRRASISSGDRHIHLREGLTAASDERGEILEWGLSPATYTVRLLDASPSTSEPQVTVHPGELSEVEFVLPVTREQLAVSGSVVDEAGEPLEGVTVRVSGGSRDDPEELWQSLTTDAEGRFECHAAPCDGLTVFLDHDLFGHEYEPQKLELPFGATDVRFRRVLEVEVKPFSLEVVDSVSGEGLDQVLLMTYRAPVRGTHAFYRTEKGLASPYLAHHPRTTIVLELQGYRRAEASLEELWKQEPADGVHRVALERGLLRRLRVEESDAENEGAPVVGARVVFDQTLLGLTDEAGEVLVDLYSWPEQGLEIEAPAFRSATWLPSEGFADLEPAVARLERE